METTRVLGQDSHISVEPAGRETAIIAPIHPELEGGRPTSALEEVVNLPAWQKDSDGAQTIDAMETSKRDVARRKKLEKVMANRRNSSNSDLPSGMISRALWEAEGICSPCSCPRVWRTIRRMAHIEHRHFDIFWLCIIGLNAAFMGIQIDLHFRTGEDNLQPVEYAFTALFLLELIIRICTFGPKKFLFGVEWKWGWLDVFVVILSLVDTALTLGKAKGDDSSLRLLSLTRLLRVGKVLRGLRYMRDLRLLLHGMINSVMAISWTLAFLISVMYVSSIVLMTLVAEKVLEGDEFYVENWAGFPESMFTLFQVMTGDSWASDIARTMSIDYGGVPKLMLMIYYFFTAIGLLNVVTGIVVERVSATTNEDAEVVREVRRKLQQDSENILREIFGQLDEDSSSGVSLEEFQILCREEDVQYSLQSMGLKTTEAVRLFKQLDADTNGLVDVDEFIAGCLRLREAPLTGDILEEGSRTRRLCRVILRKLDRLEGNIRRSYAASNMPSNMRDVRADDEVSQGESVRGNGGVGSRWHLSMAQGVPAAV
eukprot:CAMPEP_0170569922 /NCGR_PEP_ID=MMETSP0224-20130122/823_1 /TAXON_ID=285029 /ORGANISM="Togula jolla, Strain CCCM 725" /LENGTH=541 /DNA_ID=CAMNT_0010892141 /DNA_START=160 /DNA_END=1781 /DNA_ORIENTATION=+